MAGAKPCCHAWLQRPSRRTFGAQVPPPFCPSSECYTFFFWWLHMVAQILGCGGLFVRLTETAFWLTEAAFCFAIEVKYTIVGTESTQLELSKKLVESSSFSFPMSAPSGFFWDFSLQRPSWTAAMATRPGRGVILQRCRPEVIELLKVGNLYPAPIAV